MSKQRNVDFKALIAGAVPAGPEPAEPAQLAETDRPGATHPMGERAGTLQAHDRIVDRPGAVSAPAGLDDA